MDFCGLEGVNYLFSDLLDINIVDFDSTQAVGEAGEVLVINSGVFLCMQ